MVFQKLTDEQKQKLFDLKETHSKEYISKARALIMRGSTVGDAIKAVAERQKAKDEYMAQLMKEQEKEEKRSRTPRTRKVKIAEETPPPEEPQAIEDAPAKKTRGRKSKAKDENEVNIIM